MPSQTTIVVNVNLPPSGGNITITPTSGVALTTNFVISLVGYYDEDLPIT